MAGTIDLGLLPVFLCVAEEANFSAAARRLGLPKSSVSRAVSALESSVGAKLLHRTTRHVALSPEGAALYEQASPILASLQTVLGSVPDRGNAVSGLLRITAPHELGATMLGELVARFSARHPEVVVEVHLTNRVVDLQAEGIDAAVRAATTPVKDPRLVVRRLAAIETHLFAAPGYLARRGTPRSFADTARHDWVLSRAWRRGRTVSQHPGARRILGDDFLFVREALRAGAGLGPLPAFLAHADVSAGRLVRVLPRFSERGASLLLVHPVTEHVGPPLAAFRDFLLATIGTRPLLPANR